MTVTTTDGGATQNVVELFPQFVTAMAEGKDLIEDSSRDGGIFVPDEYIAIVADMEVVIEHHYKPKFGKNAFAQFQSDLLVEIARASETDVDPIEEICYWLADLLKDDSDQVLSA